MRLNRIKIVLAEQAKSNNWLGEQVGKSPVTVSRWCTNEAQPSLQTLWEIAIALDVDVRSLINSNKK